MKEELSLPSIYVQFKLSKLHGFPSSGLQFVWCGVVWCGTGHLEFMWTKFSSNLPVV